MLYILLNLLQTKTSKQTETVVSGFCAFQFWSTPSLIKRIPHRFWFLKVWIKSNLSIEESLVFNKIDKIYKFRFPCNFFASGLFQMFINVCSVVRPQGLYNHLVPSYPFNSKTFLTLTLKPIFWISNRVQHSKIARLF